MKEILNRVKYCYDDFLFDIYFEFSILLQIKIIHIS